MFKAKVLLGVLLAGFVVVPAARAQNRAVAVAVYGGGFNGVAHLNDAATADFKKTGYNVSASLGVGLSDLASLRGGVTYARNEFRHHHMESGLELSRLFYDAGVQLHFETGGLKPYVFAGAGAVTLRPEYAEGNDQTKFAGNGGCGMLYAVPGTNLALLAEGKAWIYNLSGLPGDLSMFDKTQVDVAWSAGFSYRIPMKGIAARGMR